MTRGIEDAPECIQDYGVGFVAAPVGFMAYVALAIVTYLLLVEAAKRFFYRHHPAA